MPPRKSDVSKSATGDEATPVKEKEGTNVEDLSLPRTLVQRLAKGVLPPNTQIQKDAVLAMSKGATVFINYLSSHANDNTIRAGKKTIMPKDVLEAVAELEFEGFLPRLKAELAKYNEVQADKRNSYRKKVKEERAATTDDGMSGTQPVIDSSIEEHVEGDSPPAAKKARRSTLSRPAELNGDPTQTREIHGHSGEETVSDGEGDDGSNTNEEVDEEEEDSAQQGELPDDGLETARSQLQEEDEALDNGEDSD